MERKTMKPLRVAALAVQTESGAGLMPRINRALRIALAACALPALSAFAGDTSEPAFVWVNPESCYHWHTATNVTMTLPVPFPVGASEATLSVNGSVVSSGITTDFVTVTLPAPRADAAEDVYDISLAFDKGAPVSAKLGLVEGCRGTASGTTRVLAPSGTPAWGKTKGVAVIPIPYNTTSFTVALNGGEATVTDTGLDGAAGWYALRLKGGIAADLEAETPEGDLAASLMGGGAGFFLIVR